MGNMSSMYVLSTVLAASVAPVALGNNGLSGLLHSIETAVQEHLPFQDHSMIGAEESFPGINSGRRVLQSDEPKAGFYGEHPEGLYGPYGTDMDMIDVTDDSTASGMDAAPEVEQSADGLFPKDTENVKPEFLEEFNNVFTGELTYYKLENGEVGTCKQTWKPPGFETVALNGPQFENGAACGTCLRACYNDLGLGQGEICIDAIVDNSCPECKSGDIDLLDPSGNGRWPVQWTLIKCPAREEGLLATTEGANPYYAKMNFEGGPGAIEQVKCSDFEFDQFYSAEVQPDGFWEIDPSGGSRPAGGEFRCGLRCEVFYTCCDDGVLISRLEPEQFMSDGDGCPDYYEYYGEYY